ncbi:SDR family NAD(P)-dependent oxidoreductase [Persicobacter diffluens]|uniref:Uncharacterized protein n=1 Tax=Persicobacter diffluens TaxID=981 RepID=A0AAN5AN67_9BACT|nr:hypothetical protein PEDI_31000 [Persicobacter diffluens]
MADTNQLLKDCPVAIIGMASAFADSKNLEQYWENIVDGVDCITEVPSSRWEIDDLYDADPRAEDKTYCKVGGFLPDLDFNPMEFGLPPNILEVTDSSQLLSLLVARDALMDAGYAPGSEEFNEALRQRTGCILGVGGGQKLITPLTGRLQYPIWQKVLSSMGLPQSKIDQAIEKMKKAYIPWTENSFPGMLGNVISGRVANRFDLGGINSVVDAACAASLSAIKMAVAELIEGRSDMMITGGVDTDNSPFMYMSFAKTPAFSKQGSIRPFDHEGDGMLIGEGVGMIVCKRLDDAIRDGDRVYAVLKGIGGSSDGRFKSIYAPRPEGQALAMQRAYDEAGFEPHTVGLIEAHGTGTNAGDASEAKSMGMVFSQNNETKNHIALGSVKSQVGHCKAAAGVAGMIKAALALHHKVLPGTINVTQPNPKMDIDNSPLYVNSATRPWFRKDSHLPRRASVSAFGFGGVNLHMAMEEYEQESAANYRINKLYQGVLLSAPSPSELIAAVQQQIENIQGEQANYKLKSLAASSANKAIPATHARLGFVAKGVEDAQKKLQAALKLLQANPTARSWEQPILGVWGRSSAIAPTEKTVALFAGQGSQYVNMGNALACNFPTVRKSFEAANAVFEAKGKAPLTETVFPVPVFNPAEEKALQQNLTATQNAQPAIGALSAGMYQLMANAGFSADFYAGHSYGEITALWAAGVMDDATFYQLSEARGAAMAAPANGDAGSMLAVKASAEMIEPKIAAFPKVQVANINSNNQVILGGDTAQLQQAQEALKAEGFLATMLPVAAAFHTPFVQHASAPFAAELDKANFKASNKVIFSNTTGQQYVNDPAQIKETLKGHILNPVRFREQVEGIYAAGGRVFVEFGPKNILSNLVKDILGDRPHTVIAMNANAKKDGEQQLREAAMQLAVLGMPVQAFDQAAATPMVPASVGKMNVKLSGNNYVSPQRQQAWQEAIQPAKEVEETPTEATNGSNGLAEEIEAVMVETQDIASYVQEKLQQKQQSDSEEAMATKAQLDQIQADLERLTAQQNRIETMLNALFSQPLGNILAAGAQPAAAPALEAPNQQAAPQPMATPAATPAQPAEAPAQPAPASVQTGHALSQETPAPATTPAPAAPTSTGISRTEIDASLMEVIAEKTGYPQEMLEMSMDMEADLGIDSIKRVEIFGAMTDANPSIQGVNPSDLAELRTLDQISAYIASKAGASSAPAQQPAAAPASAQTGHALSQQEQPMATAAPAAPTSGGISRAEIDASLMEVIAEKTGYPQEMLEMSMDMEADLGIDSIKRVEIFGAMTDANPSIQGVNPSDLAELRTLDQISAYIASKAGASSAPAQQPAAAPASAPVAEPVAAAPAPSAAPAAPVSGGISRSEIDASLMEVIAEKTGYPAEMLEMSMDMEADLGIDSIKRVEIFGAMTDANPSIQGVNPSDLAELRTLDQISEYIASKAGASSAPAQQPAAAPASAPVAESVAAAPAPSAAPAAPVSGGISRAEIDASLMEVIAEKTGYPAEMLEMSMDMEADLGIDSIKRVEIFGAMTDANPSIQGVNPSDLAELRTLDQISAYIAGKAGASSAPAQPAAAPASAQTGHALSQQEQPTATPAPAAPVSGGISRAEIDASLMEVIAEKTGYPAEMLEMSMDMEADLGIDSIKRVEIFGAMTDANPSIQGVNPSDLAELRTLDQISAYIAGKAGASSAPASAPVAEPVAAAPAPSAAPAAPVSGGISRADIDASLMEVIAEKTGYPAEMLEMSMDMEADLGIDSIKRVEIFGAMTDANPSIQGVNPSDLAELRTLDQIAAYIAGKAGASDGVTSTSVQEAVPGKLNGLTSFTSGQYTGVPRSEVKLKYIPQPDQLINKTALGALTLVINEGTGFTPALCEALLAHGHQVVVMTLPEALVRKSKFNLPAGVKEVVLASTKDEDLKVVVQGLNAPVAHFIYNHPHFRFPLGQLSRHFETEKALVKVAFFMAKHLKAGLNELANENRTSFMVTTRLDGALGLQNPGNVSVVGGGLFGLTKCLNLEWTNVFCRGVDLALELKPEQAAANVVAELYDADQCMTDIAYNAKGERHTLVAEEMPALQQQSLESTINQDSVFLVTGGARGVTADCVKAMAKTYHCKFILVGRSALATEEPAWAVGVEDAPSLKRKAMEFLKSTGEKPLPKTINKLVGGVQAQREILENLEYIKAQGSEVHYAAADVTDAEGLKAAVAPIVAQTGDITGLVHGAGRLADKLIENKTEWDFDAVYDVKIQGLVAATAVVDIHKIQHVVFFSSVAGFYGNVGQSDYAIANEVLNRTAHVFKKNHPEWHVSSINWGAWDAGMVSGELKKMFEAHGVSLVPSDEGPVSMVDQLSTLFADQPQVILGGTLPLAKADTSGDLKTAVLERSLKEEANPFLGHHVIQGNAVLPIINASTWMAQTAEDFYPGFFVYKVENAKLFKGIVFDGKQSEQYQISLKEQSKDAENIEVLVTIYSNTGGKLPMNHYQATVRLVSSKPKAPIMPLPAVRTPEVADASGIYTDGTLFHGTDFQGVKQIIEVTEKGCLLKCEHAGVTPERQGQFPVKSFNAFLTDIMYQGLLVWVRKYHGCGSLPLRTEWVETYNALPFGRPFYVALEVLKSDDFAMEADISAFDAETGELYMKSHRAGVTISKDLVWN